MSFENDIPVILATLKEETDPKFQSAFNSFEDLYSKKLWHQLSKELDVFYKDPSSGSVRLRLYNNFISDFKYKLNLIKLVQYLLYSIEDSKDYEESLNYLIELKKDLETKENLDSEQALILIDIETARLNLKIGEISKARDQLDEIATKLDSIDKIELKVNQSFYSTDAEYYKVKSDYNNFYYQTLLYLSTIKDLNELTLVQQQKLAYELSISALLADKVYNFGELLAHPILPTLENESYQWLVDLLYSLNSGNIEKFSKLLTNLNKIELLKQSESFLRQKICLMTLVELVFSKSIKTISFKDVSDATFLQINEVEHLVMRALSLGLLRGSIDQIDQLITINWVQPRVINHAQIESMKQRLVAWDNNTVKLGQFMEKNGKEIWTQ